MQRRVIPFALLLVLIFPLQNFAQVDPGVRGGAAGARGPLPSVAANNPTNILNFFNTGKDDFLELDSVSGTIPGEDGSRLGPRFNSPTSAPYPAHAAVGGASPGV